MRGIGGLFAIFLSKFSRCRSGYSHATKREKEKKWKWRFPSHLLRQFDRPLLRRKWPGCTSSKKWFKCNQKSKDLLQRAWPAITASQSASSRSGTWKKNIKGSALMYTNLCNFGSGPASFFFIRFHEWRWGLQWYFGKWINGTSPCWMSGWWV